MSQQLDILALEPFYGGVRRVMLDSLIHCSRHRWTLLKLPPRRIERRLSVAAHWFSEQLTRHWAGRTDLLFTSEALNLSDLYRFVPPLLNKALATVRRRGETFQLITVGPVEELLDDLPRKTLPESDQSAHVRGMLESNIFISTRINANVDHHAVRALLAGCWPLVPHSGV